MTDRFDLAIIGGGINGCGIAADAALRGLSTVLIEKNDLAAHTSSASTKLIHGGLRYLEQFDFKLVKKSLDERQALLHLAPHLIYPLPFIIPHTRHTRPRWQIAIGLWLYDHLSRKNKLPKSRHIDRAKHPSFFSPLNAAIQHGHLYYDCATDDARLTIHNALLAKEHGATILTNTKLLQGRFDQDHWILTLQSAQQETRSLTARTVINATGAWVKKIDAHLGIQHDTDISLVRGSHLIIKKLYEGDHAYLLQNDDQRVIFAIPFHDHTLIGTTDIRIEKQQEKTVISPQESYYLLRIVNQYFNKKCSEKDIITTWSGVRTLIADHHKSPQTLSRDYILKVTQMPALALSVYGGKITTYRQLAAEAIDCLKPLFPDLPSSSTHLTPLPGASALTSLPRAENMIIDIAQDYPWLPQTLQLRWMNTYGMRTMKFLSSCSSITDLGQLFGADLYQREVDYLIQEEWATTADDILWRRTKLGLIFKPDEYTTLENYTARGHLLDLYSQRL